MTDTSTQSITIAAPPDTVAKVICDFASYPEWVSAMKSVKVVEEYEYAEDISRIEWHLVEPTKLQKRQDGSYDIAPGADGGTTVTYTLAVDVSLGMFGMFRSKAEKAIMDFALKDLKRRVESLSK